MELPFICDAPGLPKTDDDVRAKFQSDYSGDIPRVLCDLYGCFRAQGHTVLSAYRATLIAHLDACGIATEGA